MKALVILSGGQDSTTCLFWAIHQFDRDNVAAVTFDYNQRHRREIDAAVKVAEMAGIADRHEIIRLGPILKGTSPLTSQAELENYNSYAEMNGIIGDRIEKTFVPMRNALFLTIAANRAVVIGADRLVTGVCEMDNANYPDCREAFLVSQEIAINDALGNKSAGESWIQIDAPLLHRSKPESIRMAQQLPGAMEALAYSHTAYDGQYPPTSRDHASVLRAQGFLEAGVPDPLVVRAVLEGLMSLPEGANYDALREGVFEPNSIP